MPPRTNPELEGLPDRINNLELSIATLTDHVSNIGASTTSPALLDQLSAITQSLNVLSERLTSLEERPPGPASPMPSAETVPPSGSVPTTNLGIPRAKLQNPTAFSGDESKLNKFISQCKLHFKAAPQDFPSDTVKILWMGSLLEDQAFDWYDSLCSLTPEPACLSNTEKFLNELQVAFGDPNRIRTAQRKLDSLRQLTSVTAYTTLFCQYASIIDSTDQDLCNQFYKGLKEDVKDGVAFAGRPDKLEEMITLALNIDLRLTERAAETRLQTRVSRPLLAPTPSSTTRPKESLTVTRTPRLKSGKLSPEEYQRRIEAKLCVYCASSDHQRPNCPIAPKTENNVAKPDTKVKSESKN